MTLTPLSRLALACSVALLAVPLAFVDVAPAASDDDPWPALRRSLLGDAPIADQARLRVIAPSVGENSASVPVTVEFDPALGEVEEFLVIVDKNPFPLVARVYPHVPMQSFSLRLRMQTAGPVRAAARDSDGVWHVALTKVRVSGGGCSVASGGGPGARDRRHGQVNVAVFGRMDGSKVRFQVVHPMETGLAKTAEGTPIPPFYVQKIEVRSGQTLLYRVELSPIARNPTFTSVVDVDPGLLTDLHVAAVDTEQEQFSSQHVMLSLDPDMAEILRERTGGQVSASE